MQPRTELRLPMESIAPALARAGVRGMSPGLPVRTAADLALLVTELVANAVKHASTAPGDEILVRLFAVDPIRVEVVDRGPGFDPGLPAEPVEGRAEGWGLHLLDSLASRWGVDRDERTNTVWFELDPEAER
jgi:sigma-B regulation protein RsbU (phosphoserine phosphatase)